MVSQLLEDFAIIVRKKELSLKSIDFIAKNVILICANHVQKQKDIKYKVLYQRLINKIPAEIIIFLEDFLLMLVFLKILQLFVMIVEILFHKMKKKDSIAKSVIMISVLIATMA